MVERHIDYNKMNSNNSGGFSSCSLLSVDLMSLLTLVAICAAASFYVGRNYDQIKDRVRQAKTLQRASKVRS
jgi:hypothetical protein